MIRRFVASGLLAAVIASVPAAGLTHAASKPAPWRLFQSKKLRFALRYPPGWTLTVPPGGLSNQVALSYQGKASYGLTVQVLPVPAASTLQGTLGRFITYETQQRNTIYSRLHWQATSLGHIRAMAGVTRPTSTEGGLNISDAVYIAQWHGRTYQVIAISYHHPPLSSLKQFPAIYREILATWRFI